MSYNEEIFADPLSGVENRSNRHSDSDLDSGSDIVVRRFKNNGRTIISDSENDKEISVTDDWSEVDLELEFYTCLEPSALQVSCTHDILPNVEMFIGDDLFSLFVTETNLYYYQSNNDTNNYASTKNKA